MSNKLFILIFIVLVFAVGGYLYVSNPEPIKYENPDIKPEPVACTMEAKLCPDGSYVGRTGPNCEFLCPAEALCEGGVPCHLTDEPVFEDGALPE